MDFTLQFSIVSIGEHSCRLLKSPIAAFHVALLRLGLEGIALVVKSLASADSKLKLYVAMLEIQLQRNDGEAFRLGLHAQLLDLLAVDKQLAVATGIMVEAVPELIYRNVHSAHVEFIPQHSTVRPGKGSLAVAHNLDLGTC